MLTRVSIPLLTSFKAAAVFILVLVLEANVVPFLLASAQSLAILLGRLNVPTSANMVVSKTTLPA
jgi:hypothetical protein